MDRLSRIDMLVELLKKEPNDIFLIYALGIEYVAELNLDEAETHFKRTLEINPDYVPSYYQLGKLFESQLKNEEALHYFRTGLEKAKEQKNNRSVNEFKEAIFMLEE
jgi:tetratricopeptide (TPR) repeat protein